ncbi:hypothetical protein FJ546_25930 [Mesorhizobium sp. B2-4-19]|uniref:SGNH/GDSL hydrolase family protein n=1 Tax=Mesorhizobium sp. B2-4-19 TaxID=2589930 RepID=UPI0011276336|nr:SGNH/GDSL hydrolase family protein [Mesorhizobium sp. B2-4-19]TPK57763.1 hypothetical protein FJ546_25930 [Mesorhizobium sp. B2-4-19]
MARPATAAVRLLTGEREPVRLATTANIALHGLQTIDGVVTEVGDRVLVKNQADARANGIYTASEGQWFRAADARTARTMQKGTTAFVQAGLTNGEITFRFNTLDPVVGADPIDITGDGDALRRSDLLDEDDMASNSATKVPSQQSVKAFVESRTARYSTEFGFVDDGAAGANTGTNNDAAWAAAKAALTHGETLVMVRKNTGVFYFSTTSDFTGILINATSNPTFNGPNVYNDRTSTQRDAKAPAVTVVGPGNLLFTSTSINVTFKHHSEPVDKFDFLTDGDVGYDEPSAADMSGTQVSMLKAAWPNGNTFATSTNGIAKSTNVITINRATADAGNVQLAGMVPEPTCQYSWVIGYNTSDVGYAVLVYEGGYHCVYAGIGGSIFHRKVTAPSTWSEVPIPHFGDGTAASNETAYTFCGASITVDMVSPTKYQIGLNGVVLAEGELPSPCLYLGPAIYFPGSLTGISNYYNFTKTKNPTRLASRPIRAMFVGDSKMDDIIIGWPRDIARIMQGSMGTQWEYTKNIAVAGETLVQQKTRLLAENMTGYTDVFVGLGTNDAQGNTSQATFATDLGLLFDQALSLGARLHVLLTPAFWDRADGVAKTGFANQGQNSAGGQRVPAYREIMRQVCATYRGNGKPVSITDAGKICGPSLARYLTWASDQNRVDLNVFDNIHESRLARTKIAQGVARSAYGVISPRRTRAYPVMAIPAGWYTNNWAALTSPVFWMDERGYKHIDGIISNAAGANLADGTQVLQLPTYMRPSRTIWLPTVTQKANTQGWIEILSTGVVNVYGVDATNKFMRLSDAHWE